ncbi:MAG: hypothetical protein BWY79_01908 [Actinobacteria bacterium ADurb.Bin444]|nr:MAG: hypothetical protein BWY79_01908 [Actinobacteria bacterium ADurb.Bin444]
MDFDAGRLEDFGLFFDEENEGPPEGADVQGFIGGVQNEHLAGHTHLLVVACNSIGGVVFAQHRANHGLDRKRRTGKWAPGLLE